MIDTRVHIGEQGYGRLKIARIYGIEIETLSFDRVPDEADNDLG